MYTPKIANRQEESLVAKYFKKYTGRRMNIVQTKKITTVFKWSKITLKKLHARQKRRFYF